jgi:hypothetical protein
MPTKCSIATSSANVFRSDSSTIAEPPYLMTTVVPRYALMNGIASLKMRAFPIVFASVGLAASGREWPVAIRNAPR